MTEQTILDMCCGSRMFWFDKQTRVQCSPTFAPSSTPCATGASPDIIADLCTLPLADGSFPKAVFDPPHLERVGENAWMGKKYSTTFKPIVPLTNARYRSKASRRSDS